MPYVWEPAPVFHSFVRNQQMVHVYHVFKNDDANGTTREYHYGLHESVSDSDAFDGGISVDGGAFDIRHLPTWEDLQGQTDEGKREIIDSAAAAGWFDEWLAANPSDTTPVVDPATKPHAEPQRSRTVVCTIPVVCPDHVSPAVVVRLLGMMIDVGVSDAADSAGDENLDDDARAEAEIAASLDFGEVSANAGDRERYACGVGDVTSISRPSNMAENYMTSDVRSESPIVLPGDWAVNEQGNTLLLSGDCEAYIAWIDLLGGRVLEISLCPANDPALEVGILSAEKSDKASLAKHVSEHCAGWYIKRLNLDGVLTESVDDGLVVVADLLCEGE